MDYEKEDFSHDVHDGGCIVREDHLFGSSADCLGHDLGCDQHYDCAENDGQPIRHQSMNNQR